MYVLDTDHVTILQLEEGTDYHRLNGRLGQVERNEVFSTVVSYEEQTRGWLSYAARSRTVAQLVESYRRLGRHLEDWRRTPVLPFDAHAAIRYQQLLRSRPRVSSMDLRIAAIALSRGATLLTRNLRDFRQVPGLLAEDWTA